MEMLKNATRFLAARFHPPTRQLVRVQKALEQGDWESAIKQIETTRQQYPKRPDVNTQYAQIFAGRKEWDKVRLGLGNILGNPKSRFPHLIEAARLMRKMGDDKGAILLFSQLGNDSFKKRAGLCWIPIGNIYNEQGELDKALSAYTECICRGGPAVWSHIIKVIQQSSLACVVQCRKETLERPQEKHRRYRYFKLLSLLEHRMCVDGDLGDELMMQSMRKATDDSFNRVYPKFKLDENSPPLRPSFLIIGAMKCGTTSLFELISQHPKCLATHEKEHQFFQFSHLPDPWYLEHFPRIDPSRGYVTGDASPGYYIFDIVDRVKTLLPNVKLIFIQRDPARRAISHIQHNSRVGLAEFSSTQAIARIDELQAEIESNPKDAEQLILDITYGTRKHNNFLALGCYELLLRRWRREFKDDQLKVVQLEDLRSAPQKTMNQVFDFIGLAPIKVEAVQSNAGDYDESETEIRNTLERLTQFYEAVKQATQPGSSDTPIL